MFHLSYVRGRRNFVFNFGSTKLTGHTLRFGLPLLEYAIVVLLVIIRGESFAFTGVLISVCEALLLRRLYGVLEANSSAFGSSNDVCSVFRFCVRRVVMNFSFNGVMDCLIVCTRGFLLCALDKLLSIINGLVPLVMFNFELKKLDGRSFSLSESMLAISEESDIEFSAIIVLVAVDSHADSGVVVVVIV